MFKNRKIKQIKRPKKGFRPPRISLKSPIKAVGDALGTAKDAVQTAAGEVGEKLAPVGEAVSKVTKPIGVVLDPVVEAVDHVEHALKTGDFGKQVEKLLEEQDKAKAELQEETYLLHEAAATLVQLETRSYALAQIDQRFRGHGGAQRVPPRPEDMRQVEFDLYGNPATETLERIGLKPVAEGIKFIREITYLMPNELMFKQVELAKVRKALRENIARYEDTTDEVRSARADIQRRTRSVRQRIREIEEEFAVAGIDISPTSAVEREVQDIENAASHTLALSLLAEGHTADTIAQITGLTPAEITALEPV